MKSEDNATQQENLKFQFENKTKEFKWHRFDKEYSIPDNVRAWRDAFILHLEDQKYIDAQIMANIVWTF